MSTKYNPTFGDPIYYMEFEIDEWHDVIRLALTLLFTKRIVHRLKDEEIGSLLKDWYRKFTITHPGMFKE